MTAADADLQRGLERLRLAVACALAPRPVAVGAGVLLSEAVELQPGGRVPEPDAGRPCSSEADVAEANRLIGLVELARGGDTEAFGLLYDHYHASVYRFVYYRVGSATIAEDLAAETFFRALRSMSTFRWQGKDFGAWLMTIARNLTADHYKAGRTRLEYATEDMSAH
ncbi:MAG TPA: sigma factor, partial [Nocardioidaceae bacterium]|nr:sigma factor [Nocardioidaceae bacterium]